MKAKYKNTGLCVNCLHAPECGYFNKDLKPVIFCEEFCYEEGCQVMNAQQIKTPEKPGAQEYGCMGLCVNCENRDTCKLNRGKSSVWYCEEYR